MKKIIYRNLEVVDDFWVPGGPHPQCMGVIICKHTVNNEMKAYVGLGLGVDKETDILNILENGTKVSAHTFREILDKLENPKTEWLRY